jgi:transcriptional regulator GlxA family with amidase domain
MLANVAGVVLDGFSPFELGVVCEVFGVDRTDDGLPPTISPWSRASQGRCAPTRVRRCVERGGRVLGVCNGAFALGAARLLDSRCCTTHWRHTQQLARRFPAAKVDPSVLYVEDGPVITSAGTAAGIDACLYLVRKEQGSRVANAIARRMVVPPHRDGGQAQYVERPAAGPAADTLGEVIS